jgi:hypothetical protein
MDIVEGDNFLEYIGPEVKSWARIDLDTISPEKEGEILYEILRKGIPKERQVGFEE